MEINQEELIVLSTSTSAILLGAYLIRSSVYNAGRSLGEKLYRRIERRKQLAYEKLEREGIRYEEAKIDAIIDRNKSSIETTFERLD